MVSLLIVTINHIWMYTYVSENFIIDLLASDVNCYKKTISCKRKRLSQPHHRKGYKLKFAIYLFVYLIEFW